MSWGGRVRIVLGVAVLGGVSIACGLALEGGAILDVTTPDASADVATVLDGTVVAPPDSDVADVAPDQTADAPPGVDASVDAFFFDADYVDAASFDVRAFDVAQDVLPDGACQGTVCNGVCVVGLRCPCLGAANCPDAIDVCLLSVCTPCGDPATQNHLCKDGVTKCHQQQALCK